MKKIVISILFFISILPASVAQNTILEARQMGEGAEVTVTGIATNGSELGIIRYFQDSTAGLAAYGSAVSSVNRGDEITVTGTLKSYNQLLELDPITNITVNSTGNDLPDPILLTPAQMTETYEGMLIEIHHVVFNDAGLLFSGNNEYEFSANGEGGVIYVKNGQDLVGTVIPTGEVNLVGICSQFDYSNPNAGYQLLLRDLDDINQTSSIYLTGKLDNTDFTKTTLDFNWNTNIAGTTELFYGPTEGSVTSNYISSTGGDTGHDIGITDLNPGEITWVEAFSVNGSDTAFSAVLSFATISNSSGNMIAYFNTPVDHSYSNGVDAIYLPQTIDDTLINYINRAKHTIDLTIYNFNNAGISNISDALIAAADRGVRVRVIGCGTTNNLGINELLGTSVHVLIGPNSSQRTGIMHNKFVIFDAQSDNPNEPIVWTGSTNFTKDQINLDANNVIIVQDQSLARAYQIEFEEMWGSHGDEPDASNSRFGSAKRDNTPHEFMIDGKYVECYFSPSDGVNSKIVEVINSANSDLSIATMLITRTEMANAIADRKAAGVAVNVITNSEGGNSSTVNSILTASLSTHFTFDDVSSGLLHNKYMIVDQYSAVSDPMVFTGSHNWSAAADNDNDENTLIIHDDTLANIYYQQFVYRFVENLGVLFDLTTPPTAVADNEETVIDKTITIQVLDNDIFQAPVTLSIQQPATHGNSFIPFANPNVISYMPNEGFHGTDSITYKIAYKAEPTLFATTKIYITVFDNSGIDEFIAGGQVNIYPNPTSGVFNISFATEQEFDYDIIISDVTGRQLLKNNYHARQGLNNLNFKLSKFGQGIYFLNMVSSKGTLKYKLIVR